MSDASPPAGLDRTFVTLYEPHDVRAWRKCFGCTLEQLTASALAVGHSVEEVRENVGST